MNRPRGWPARVALLACALFLGACTHAPLRVDQQAADYAEQARSSERSCPEPCQIDSPLLALGDAALAESTAAAPRHRVILLDAGQDSLLARVHLIRAARRNIDLQTFHFEPDEVGRVVLDELLAAARRGVKVRLMMDQLNGLARPEMQARLASFHHNFELRIYNPVMAQADISTLEFAASVVFRLRDLNRRMHNKMMIVDDRVAVIGGRNIQDEYFDWHPDYNYRDRDLLVAGPVVPSAMKANFDGFWNDYRSLPPTALSDVAELLKANKGPPPDDTAPASARVRAMAAKALDGAAVYARLQPFTYSVGPVEFYGDLPTKHDLVQKSRQDATRAQLDALRAGKREILLQTPYLVLSRPARKLFRELHERQPPLPVLVSTNSLAATDAFPAYAMSHKYKRMFMRELGFQIHEYKPFPADMPIDLRAVPGAVETLARQGEIRYGDPGFEPSGFRQGPVPLKRAGVRIGLHSKSMVVDEEVAIVGSHNFDPRSSDYNTESLLLIRDPVFARALADSIRRDIQPENSWTVAPRPKLPVLWGLNYNLGKLSEKLPIFDVWPLPYATSYEIRPGCKPLPPSDPGFQACYEMVGDFPEVNLSLKMVYTRVLTVFGAGFIPFL
jgi:phosphatidylserine/phosphatidylglycerophosphate/cardiolipin synthase-like enzyme